MKILAINCNPDVSYEKSKGLDLTVTNSQNLQKFPVKFLYKVKDADGSMVDMYTLDLATYMEQAYGKSDYSIVYYAWKPTDYGPEMAHTGGFTCPQVLSNGCVWISVRNDLNFLNYFHHETTHAATILLANRGINVQNVMDLTLVNGKYLPYYENDYRITDPNSNFNQQWKLLSTYINILNGTMTAYKYFKANEIVGLKPELVAILDKMRGECGFPFIINSGFRTVAKNSSLSDAVGDSAHLSGLAVDLAITDSIKRLILIKVALSNGISRFGIGSTFVHIDISKTLPQNVCWVY